MKREIIVNKKGFKSKEELTNYLERTKAEIDNIIRILKSPEETVENKIIVHYIISQSLMKTCEAINKQGYKTAKGNKYISNDISDLIKNGSSKVNPTLLELSKSILDKNWKTVSRVYN